MDNLSTMLGGLCQMLHSDVDLPVRVEAAFALQALVADQKQGTLIIFSVSEFLIH